MRRGGVSFILGEIELPLLDLFQVSPSSKSDDLKRRGTLLGLGFWYGEWE
jgi:hypothetical protein